MHNKHNQRNSRVPFICARFYAGCVIDALSYLHRVPQRIVYRDVKPENLLIDSEGYLKLVDFGFAKRLRADTAFRTYTFCGTPDYLAPELLAGRGYDESIDVWAVGILIFEMVFGYAPFGEVPPRFRGPHEPAGDMPMTPQQTMRKIMTEQVKFPRQNYVASASAKVSTAPEVAVRGGPGGSIRGSLDAMRRAQSRCIVTALLEKAPLNRLGCGAQGGIHKVFREDWFSNFDPQALHGKRLAAPWKPELGGEQEVVEPAEQYAWQFPIQTYHGSHEWCEGW